MSKYNRTYHFPFSPGATNDDRIASSLQALIGTQIIITEKLDGENCGMEKGGVYARSHAAYTTSGWSREVRNLHNLIGRDLPENLMLFGENMEGIHSIEYSRLESYFYLFGAREDGNRWLSWTEIEEIAYLLDIPTVPVLFKGRVESEKELKDLVEMLVSRESQLGSITEGCVARVAGSFYDDDFSSKVLKWVRKGHVTTSSHWTRNWKKASLYFPTGL
jgi:hypothetical protein